MFKPARSLLLFVLVGCGFLFTVSLLPSHAQEATDLVNLDHLNFLTEPVTINGKDMAIVHIYSEKPDYEWVDAAGEGITAVDDVARAAVVYLWQYEQLKTKDTPEADEALHRARLCLEFVRYMQTSDGAFYNFVFDREGEINKTGNTSYKSVDWWAMRALWSLGEGIRIFKEVDPAYTEQLTVNYLLTEQAISVMITNYGDMTDLHGFKIPAWLPNGAADSTSVGLLGMVAYYRANPNPTTANLIEKIADGVAAFQLGNHQAYPFGMHPVTTNAPGYWHDWGAHQGQALAEAGMVLNRQDWVDSAAEEANTFLIRHLLLERFRDIGVVPNRLGQIAYGTNSIVQTYVALYKATGDEAYARYAGLAASWLFGNNMAGVQMYDPDTGRVYDGIEGPVSWRVNQNAGAESTIEGLLTLLAVNNVPVALPYLHAQSVSGISYDVLEAETGQRIAGQPIYYTGDWVGSSFISRGRYVGLGEGDEMELSIEIPADGLYFVYVAHLRQTESAPPSPPSVVRVTTQPEIDGKLDEWDAVPTIGSNTREQFLRGVGLWKGPDVDSHSVQLTWDDDNLYLAVSVRAPQHVQDFTLSEIWHGEATWVYFVSDPNKNSLSSKFSLAQTPDGPQVWDWIRSNFLEDTQMAWSETDNGFIYEAAIPWTSIRMSQPQVGSKIGLEVGRSIGGNSFMDLTGQDPDVVSNLLPITLVDSLSTEQQAAREQEPIFLSVQIGDENPLLVPTNVSPDSEYWWLDRVTRFPIRLTEGEYPLHYAYAGTGQDGLSKVDAFYVQPVKPQRKFQLSDGRLITLTYDTITGKITYEESS